MATSSFLGDNLGAADGLDVGWKEAGEFSSKPSLRWEVRVGLFCFGGEPCRGPLRLQPFSSPLNTKPRIVDPES